MEPILIGLTGGIGVGKSSVAAVMKEHGAEIVEGDELGRISLEGSPELLETVNGRYGASVFSEDGKLQRRELGKRIFASADETRWLTNLTFPGIHKLWQEAIQRARTLVVVLDAALIFDWGIEGEFDFLVVVTASAETVRRRLVNSGRLSEAEVIARQNIQSTTRRGSVASEYRIVNDGLPDDLRRQVDTFWRSVVKPELQRRRAQ